MTDAAEVESLLEDGAHLPEVVDEVIEHDPQEKTSPRGYMSKEAWIESGKPADDWVSEEVYKERGERIKQTAKLQKDFENQLKNLNLLHQVQLKSQREQLLSKRDDAIDIADKDAVKALDKQIKELDKLEELTEEQAISQEKPVEVVLWESDNPWINDPKDPRTALAQKTFVAATKGGMGIDEALEQVDAILAKKFSSKSTPVRQTVEGSRPSSGKRDDSAPTMKNLSRDEQKAWESGLFDNEKDFLKAVANDRKGVK